MNYRGLRASGVLAGLFLGASVLAGCGGAAPPPEEPDPSFDEGTSEGKGSPSEVSEAAQAIQAGDFPAAKGLLEKALQAAPEDAQANYYYGVVLEETEQAEQAVEHYQRALSADKQLVEAAVNLSRLLLEVNQDAAAAAKVADEALKVHPKHPELLLNLALALETSGSNRALEAYAAAAAASPDSMELKYTYAEILVKAGKNAEAKAELLRIVSEDVAILASVGTLLGKIEAFADCVAALDKAIAQSPLPQLYTRRATCKNGLKDVDGATADYRAAIEKEPESPAGHYYLGKHLAAAGKKKDAKAALDQALKLDPTGKVGAAAKDLLKTL